MTLLKNIIIYTGIALTGFFTLIIIVILFGWPSWAAIIGSGA